MTGGTLCHAALWSQLYPSYACCIPLPLPLRIVSDTTFRLRMLKHQSLGHDTATASRAANLWGFHFGLQLHVPLLPDAAGSHDQQVELCALC